MNAKVGLIITIVAAFLLWNVVPKLVAVILFMIGFVLLVNKWDDLKSIGIK